jgi:hypothetical protein
MRYLGVLFVAVFLLCIGQDALAYDPALTEGRMRACGSASDATDANKYMECANAYEHWYYNVRPSELARQAEQARRAREHQIDMEYNAKRESQRQEAERRRQMELEERRVRAMEESAQAQRDAANAANAPRTCKTVGFQNRRPIIECYTPNIPATRNGY